MPATSHESPKSQTIAMPQVVIADDDPVTRHLCASLVQAWGYDPVMFEDGRGVLELYEDAAERAPRIAVLDWVMPDVSGLEVCAALNERNGGQFVYTILLTGKRDIADAVSARNAGAHDYIVKPFEPLDLKSRISVAMRLVKMEETLETQKREIAHYANSMEELAAARAQQLIHADRMVTLGMMSAGMAHEVNNPASFISGNVQTLQQYWTLMEPLLAEAIARGHPDKARLEYIAEEGPKAMAGILEGVQRISSIVRGLKSYVHRGTADREPCAINRCIEHALALCHNALKYTCTTELSLGEALDPVLAQENQIEQVLVNLLVNARDAMAPGGGCIRIRSWQDDEHVRVRVSDEGPGLPEAVRKTLWDPFVTTKQHGDGTGLGLSISKDIIDRHGGTIYAKNGEQGGAVFEFALPRSATSGEEAK